MSKTYDLSLLEDIDLAAAEYALGSLDESQKAQFEALLAVSHDTQIKVSQWQAYVQQGLHDFEPQAPSNKVWSKIAMQLGHQSQWGNWFNNLKVWQGISASALALSLVIVLAPGDNAHIAPSEGVNVATITHTSPDLNYVMYNAQQEPAWIINASTAQKQFSIDTIAPDPMANGKVCELWLIVGEGENKGEPISLGILPKQGRMHLDFGERVTQLKDWQKLLQQGQLVISVELPSGAASGYDMGPILDQGPWVNAMAGPIISI